MLYKFLFPSKPDGAAASTILLIVRIVFGVLLMNHGIENGQITRSCPLHFLTRWV